MARTGVAATHPIAIRVPSSETDAAASTMYVLACSYGDAREPVSGITAGGTEIFVSSSPTPTEVTYTPTKNASAGTTRSPAAADRERRVECNQQRRQVVRRIADADVTSDGAAISHLHVGDRRSDSPGSAARLDLRGAHDLRVRSHCADLEQAVGGEPDRAGREVDEHAGGGRGRLHACSPASVPRRARAPRSERSETARPIDPGRAY